MSTVRSESPDIIVTATDLLAYDEEQFAQFLEGKKDDDGQYSISSVAGVMELPKSQRDELGKKIRAAKLRLEFKVDELHARLADLANEPTRSPVLAPQHTPTPSPEPTPPPGTLPGQQIWSRQGLIEDGGRPACSIQELVEINAEPLTRHVAIISWLTDDPDTETGNGEIKTVFSTQFTRWWEFRKSQLMNRGLGEDEEGVLAFFVTACRRKYERMGQERYLDTSFDEGHRRLWQHMKVLRQLPDGEEFSAYKDAVEMRLRPHRFTRRLQLKKDPRKQDVWTNWLEYLNFESWDLEQLTAGAESLEPRFLESWRLLKEREAEGGVAPSQRPLATRTIGLDKGLKVAQPDRDASNRAIRDFVTKTERYKRARAAAYFQKHRVNWVVKEARVLEAELAEQTKVARKTKKTETGQTRKRRHTEILGATGDELDAGGPRRSARLAKLQPPG